MEPEQLLSGSSIICIGTLLMVPQLSVLSLALCHEALEGGGNHKTETSITKKKLMETIGWKPASQKETSPFGHFSGQFTASQKLPLLVPNVKLWSHEIETSMWKI